MVDDTCRDTSTPPLRLGVIGMSEGNGHPYSWSAIFNGYNMVSMANCPFPAIPEYLTRQSFPEDCIPNGKVTHIWTQDKKKSEHIGVSSKIAHVVEHFEDMIGEIDAVLLARDDTESHLPISLPFLKAGIPVYIDKPIATDCKTLDTILQHEQYPGQIFSCSALRFAKEFNLSSNPENPEPELGHIGYVEATIGKDWEKYGVHLIDPILHVLGLSGEDAAIQAIDLEDKRIVIARWRDISVKFTTLGSLKTPIVIRLYGTNSMRELVFRDTFFAFKQALQVFIDGFTRRRYMINHGELRGVVSIIERGMPQHV